MIYLFFALPDRILQFFTRDLWCSRHFFSVADVHVNVAFISIFVLLIVVVKFFVEFTKGIGDPLRHVMISPLSFLIFVMSTFFFAELTMTMTMTMTHSEKSRINQMRAWPYRQECRDHGPSKKNLFYWGNLLIGKVCKYKLLWTECNASRLEMNSMYKKTTKKRDHTGCCCAEFSTNSLNPQIRSNTTDRTRRTKEARKPEGETRKPGGTRAPGGWRDTAVQQSHLLLIPNFVLSYNK